MALISPPGTTAVDRQDESGTLVEVNATWRIFFQAVYTICSALTQSGTTAQRPTVMLWPGRMYMDLTLNQPIWRTAAGWRDATGALV